MKFLLYYLNIIIVHKKFLNESSGDSNQGLSPHESPLPDKITNSAQKKPLKIPMKTLNIPKLDLTQAKKIQEINAKKITPQPNMNNVDIQIQEKYKRWVIKLILSIIIEIKFFCIHIFLCFFAKAWKMN